MRMVRFFEREQVIDSVRRVMRESFRRFEREREREKERKKEGERARVSSERERALREGLS